MQTLMINAHPDYKNLSHHSIKIQAELVALLKQDYPTMSIDILNLYEQEIPRIEEGQLLSIWEKERTGESLNDEELRISMLSTQLLKQFKNHHRIMIFSPLHNFNVTSRLKDYIDNILIARETFRYTEEGSVGLMKDDYKMIYIQASGSIYTNNDRYTKLDFAPQFLEGIFQELMGFNDFTVIRAEGTAILPESEVMEKALEEIKKTLDSFYRK